MNKWISVRDRLPEDDEKVLISCKNKAMFVAVFKRMYFSDEVVWDVLGPLGTGRRVATARVTHWRNLPELPNDESPISQGGE